MRSYLHKIFVAAFASLVLSACTNNNFADLEAFVEEKKARPGGIIAPIPTFKAYEAFSYSAASQRSPFDRPIEVREIAQLQAISSIKPDETRAKEFLEQYTFDSLSLVGTLERGEIDWSLIRDPEGGVHRVKQGNYLGRNHGKIVDTTDTYIAVIEIVSDGSEDGWVERPRTIKLNGI
ncbi:MAG: pilus assembly protein PilP [Gammaproteobacteria bacterium]|nr:MAG: pilus assembly protein PilP [Gammaproteobacteria bacterium]RLA50164.1 MAG: pilus assembly protein PilP [Gammaproteobacteria bacterium]